MSETQEMGSGAQSAPQSGGTWHILAGFALASAVALALYFVYAPNYVAKEQVATLLAQAKAEATQATLEKLAQEIRLEKPGTYRVIASGPIRVMGDDKLPADAVQVLVTDSVITDKTNVPLRYPGMRLATIPLVQVEGSPIGASHLTLIRREVLGKEVEIYKFSTTLTDPNGPMVSTRFAGAMDLSFMASRIGDVLPEEPQQAKPIAKAKSYPSTVTVSNGR